jgi:cytochrome P450
MKFFYLAAVPITLFVVFRTFKLIKNFVTARAYNLPIVLLPVSFEDAWWMLLRPLFPWVEHLPFGLGHWYFYTDIGWPMIDGKDTISRLGGETFVLVSPTRNQIVTAYPPGAQQIYRDMKTWEIPTPFSQAFTFYGQNVSSLNGADWQRHRRITGPAFNDQAMRQVWNVSVERAAEIFNFKNETVRTGTGIRSEFEMLAMHVLADVAFGQDTDLTDIPPGHRLTLMDSLGFILKHVFMSIIFAGVKVPDAFLPPVLRRLKASVAEFRLYMGESVLRQMQAANTQGNKEGSKRSLLASMVAANEAEKAQKQQSLSRPTYLTDSELYGNLFVFNLAGFETTAGTMTFALPYLATHPKIQEWVREEVDLHYTSSSAASFEETYPKLVRCLALMYETLRLSGPAPQMIRSPTVPVSLRVSEQHEITVQPETLVSAHFYSIHLSERWGPDADAFKPKRFVQQSPTSGQEELANAPEGAMFIGWVFGPRVCPGKKFSQVEFVAVIAFLLSKFRLEVLRKEGEDEEMARARVFLVLKEKVFNVSAHLKQPEDVGVRFVPRL